MLPNRFLRSRMSLLPRNMLPTTPQMFATSSSRILENESKQTAVSQILNRFDSSIHSMSTKDVFQTMIDSRIYNIHFSKFHPTIKSMIHNDKDNADVMGFILSNLSAKSRYHDEDYLFMLDTLGYCLRESSVIFTSRQLAVALQSLKGVKSTHSSEVKSFLVALTQKIESCVDIFDGESLSLALNSFHFLGNNQTELANLLHALTAKIPHNSPLNSTEQYMNPSQFSSAIFGLKKMSSKHEDAMNILKLLPSRLHPSTLASSFKHAGKPSRVAAPPPDSNMLWKATNISQIIYSLNQMQSFNPQVRVFLKEVVLPGLMKCNGREFSNPHCLRTIMYGLQGMNTQHTEVSNLMTL
jgi:hypothetical protein